MQCKKIRYFCLNSGSCGSQYIVELFKVNGLHPSYHQLQPELDDIGIDFYENKIHPDFIKSILYNTRKKAFFESSNRLFSMGKVIREIFPNARFIHLHRDPRQVIASGLSKPYSLTWGSGRKRYLSKKLCGSRDSSLLEKSCRYWANYNFRIFQDLQGSKSLSLKFSDLVSGNLSSLEKFTNTHFSIKRIPPVNANKPVRKEGYYPPFDKWSQKDKQCLQQIVDPVAKLLGYDMYDRSPFSTQNPDIVTF